MAVDFRRSFSIREFASKMRSVDVEKSWPFLRAGDELPKEEKDRMLPPMVCKKYRWWGDELKAARLEKPETELPGKEAPEEDPTVKICPVCETFTASTMNAVNAHIDSCLSQASKDDRRKAKSRAPKKRSIVEIFAVAPQIERQEEEDDDDDEEDEYGEGCEEEGGRLEGEEDDAALLNVSSSSEAAGLKVNKRKRKVKKIRKDLAETMATQTKQKKKRRKNKLKIKKNLLKKKKKKNILKKKKKKQHSSGILAFSNRLFTEKVWIFAHLMFGVFAWWFLVFYCDCSSAGKPKLQSWKILLALFACVDFMIAVHRTRKKSEAERYRGKPGVGF